MKTDDRRAPLHAVKAVMAVALLSAAGALRAADASAPPEIPGPAERGINPDTTLITIKDMLVNQKMDLLFEVPLVPPVKMADNFEMRLSTFYNSNILSWLDDRPSGSLTTPAVAFIPTYRSPLGVGFEMPGWGHVYQSYRDRSISDFPGADSRYLRDWLMESPDGNVHVLYVATRSDAFPPRPSSGINSHLLYGNTFLKNLGGGAWQELYQSSLNHTFEYFTADDSLIRARLTLDGSGLPASWQVFYPDGNIVTYDRRHAPPGKSVEQLYYNPFCCGGSGTSRPCPIHIDQADPQSLSGFYPTRVSNRMGVGFSLFYENPSFPYLVTRISPDGSRVNGDILFAVDATGHYQTMSYPAASGNRVNITFDYLTQSVRLRNRDGSPMMDMDGGTGSTAPEPLKSVVLLSAIHWPGGYTQSFTYHDENSPGTSYLGSARIRSITLPAGASHAFTYKLFPFQEYTYTPNGPRASVGIATRITRLFPGAAPGSPDSMQWSYAQNAVPAAGGALDALDIVTDPAGNDTVHYFFNAPVAANNNVLGLLKSTSLYEGNYAPSKSPRRVINNNWGEHRNTGTTTQFFDDPKADNSPNDLNVQRLDFDGWGHFSTVQTDGSTVPTPRRTLTGYSVSTIGTPGTTFTLDGSIGPAANAANDWGQSCADPPVGFASIASSINSSHPQVAGCAYRNGFVDQWLPSLPVSVEVQENVGGAWQRRSLTETQYDPLRGLPLRTIKRQNPAAPADDLCAMNLTPRAAAPDADGVIHRDEVSDFYYDSRGNLALTVNSGGEDDSRFRAYTGVGTPPAPAQAPVQAPAVGFPGGGELIYPDAGAYFGFNRWAREFSPAEGADHQFLDFSIGESAAEVEPASGAILKTADASGLTTAWQYDDTGRRVRQQFLGDGAAPDAPVHFKYINLNGRQVGAQTLQRIPGDESQTALTQDYLDAWGRKIISRRRNPGGRFSFQVTHYDEMGNVDDVSFWSFAVPPGIGAESCTTDQLLDPATVCPSLDPSQWTSADLLAYITVTAGSHTRNCYRVSPNGANNYRCDDAAPYEFKGRVRRVERIGKSSGLLGAVDTVYFGLNTKVIVHNRTDGLGDPSDSVTISYKDGFGNLRIVDADAGATNPQGADAIYDYDYGDRLIKANLVPQVTFANTPANRLATTNPDHQVRVESYDALGRKTSSLAPESGLIRYLRYNARGQLVEMEDENGRIGGGPGGGIFSTTPAPSPGSCVFDPTSRTWDCPSPTVIINGAFAANGELSAQWNGWGIRHVAGGGNVPVPASELYYRASLDAVNGAVLMDWTLGRLSLRTTGIPAGTRQLWVQVSYGPFTDSGAIPANFTFTDDPNPRAYHLLHLYDSRGREIAVQKKPATGALTTLRQFGYESSGQSCAPNRSCGKMTGSVAMRTGAADITTAYDFLNFSPTIQRHDGRLGRQFSGIPSSIAAAGFETRFDYDGFGRLRSAFYPTPNGPASPTPSSLPSNMAASNP